MCSDRVVIIGAGVGGLATAARLASRGVEVIVLEKLDTPGGKMRCVEVAGRSIDAGPTVLTMRNVFEELFTDCGRSLSDSVTMKPATTLARHAWRQGEHLDLFADRQQSADAVGRFAGSAAARGYLEFCAHAKAVYETMNDLFIRAERPTPGGMVRNAGLGGMKGLWNSAPYKTLWKVLGDYFTDPRLRQLFGRYATYCGSSPFEAPATLALIAHVEQAGVWTVDGGMKSLARALSDLACASGAKVRFATAVSEIIIRNGRTCGVKLESGEVIEADAVVAGGDVGALIAGDLGRESRRAIASDAASPRSLSALTWKIIARPSGFPLAHHSVFFSRSCEVEFAELFSGRRTPSDPTVYICAQDRKSDGTLMEDGSERMLIIVNAPADGGRLVSTSEEWHECQNRMMATLARSGLTLEIEAAVATGPLEFSRLFPGTQGALYGMASHGWTASFRRPGARSQIPGLYLTGGSVHPGAGLPMVAMSGRAAAEALIADLPSMRRSRPTAMRGGTSTR